MSFNFEVTFYKSSDECNELLFNVRKFVALKLKGTIKEITLQEKKEKRFYKDLRSNVWFFNGTVLKRKVKQINLIDLIDSYCDYDLMDNTLITFDDSIFERFPLFRADFVSNIRYELLSIELGTIVKLNQFVSHLEIGEDGSDLQPEAISVEFDKQKLFIDVFTFKQFRFIVNFNSINRITLSKTSGFWFIYLAVSTPPLLYEVCSNNRDYSRKRSFEIMNDQLDKVTYSKQDTLLREITFNEDIDPERITRSNVIRLIPVSPYNESIENWKHIWTLASNLHRYTKVPIYIGNMEKIDYIDINPFLPEPRNLPFNIHYAFGCLQSTYQLHDELNATPNDTLNFIKMVEKYSKINPKATEEALYDLFSIKMNSIPVNPFYAFKNCFKTRKSYGVIEQQENIVEIKKCFITPSRIILLPPFVFKKSRMYRDADPEFILRVYAKDENFEALNYTVLGRSNQKRAFIYERFQSILSNEIQIRNRRYEFLGSSSSQMQEFSMNFYAEDNEGRTGYSLREDIGNLSHLSNAAKRIARIGQVFSQPIAFYPHLPHELVQREDDITGGLNPSTGKPYIFSDGIGKISTQLAKELTSLVDKNRTRPFSAFQIRYGGAKGMVAIDPTLIGMKMILRESMIKFLSNSTSLDIIKVSEPRDAFFNRNFINILNQLGVSNAVFASAAIQNFQRLIDSYSCKCKALDVINRYSMLNINFHALKNSEIDIFGEEFFSKILDIVVNNSINEVKLKARIKVADENGRTMFGIVDETGTLNEGEVFVQYSNKDNYMIRKVVTDEVVVTKNPCIHPGDVRKFKAVDITKLHHICDCIVFPQKGLRPHPDEMAGSDLDGDEYVVIWDKYFIFPGNNEEAMDYSPPKNLKITSNVGDVTVDDMLKFNIDFILNNNTGRIANAHLAISDYLHNGIFDKRCIELAKQHSQAVDSSKNGIFIPGPMHLPISYPDFMEKSETNPTHKSKRALGLIYRLSSMFSENQELNAVIDSQVAINDALLTFTDWQCFKQEAENALFEYKRKIMQIQRQFGVDEELSLLTCVSGMKTQNHIYGKNESYDTLGMIRVLVTNVFDEMGEIFNNSLDGNHSASAKKALASAWYQVTRQSNQETLNKYIGLPWIVSNILCEIAKDNSINGIYEHVCNLNEDIIAKDLKKEMRNLAQNELKIKVEEVLKLWLKKNLKLFRGYQFISQNVEQLYKQYFKDNVLKVLESVKEVDIAVECVLRSVAMYLRSDFDCENMLALTAYSSIRRYQRTKLFSSFTEISNPKDIERETAIICVSLDERYFRDFFSHNSANFHWILTRSGVKRISLSVKEDRCSKRSFLYVSGFGRRKYLKKLKNALCDSKFFERIVNQQRWSFY